MKQTVRFLRSFRCRRSDFPGTITPWDSTKTGGPGTIRPGEEVVCNFRTCEKEDIIRFRSLNKIPVRRIGVKLDLFGRIQDSRSNGAANVDFQTMPAILRPVPPNPDGQRRHNRGHLSP